MKNVMIDFETLGNGKNACVIQVAACYFDDKTGETGETYKANIDARTSVKNGAQIDADTVYWWLAQSKEAIDSVTGGNLLDETQVFNELNQFLKPAKNIWSHATFDFVILMEALKRLGIKPNFSYRDARDIRTLISLAQLDHNSFKREGLHHDGLEDCKFQVKYCVPAIKKLLERT